MSNPQRFARPPRILIASDQNAGLRDLETLLSGRGYSVFRIYAGSPTLARARAMSPDVVLLDDRLGDTPSLELSRALRDDPLLSSSTPILLLTTGQSTPQDHLTALRAGIWELLRQPLNLNDVLLKLDSYVLARIGAETAPTATLVDDVTGLYTAQGLTRRARELLFQAGQHNTSAACVVFAFEPAAAATTQASAELVRRVGQVLKAAGRRADAIGRIAPTEFAIVAPGTDAGGAVKLAERLRRSALLGATGEAGVGPGFEVRAGYDAVSNVRYTPVEPNRLLARAARALQQAKAEGKWIQQSSAGP
jgi:diguanylate cyclase (GGDEF)-like protein